MLKLEKLVCDNSKYHKKCEWERMRITYSDKQYNLLKQRLSSEVKRTGTAYRIIHGKFGLLTTLKRGHDGRLWAGDDNVNLRKMLFYNPIE